MSGHDNAPAEPDAGDVSSIDECAGEPAGDTQQLAGFVDGDRESLVGASRCVTDGSFGAGRLVLGSVAQHAVSVGVFGSGVGEIAVVGGEDLVGDEQRDGWPRGDEPGHRGGVGGGDVPARGSLSAAIKGRRLARLTLDPQPQLRPEPAEQLDQADNDQAEDPPADPPARNAAEGHSTASGSEAGPKAESGRAGNPAEGVSRPAAGIVFTGSGDGIVQLTKNAPGPAAVRISGNQTSNHFKVRALATQDVVVVTTGPYQGVRPLDWDGGNSTGFEVTNGPWRIEVMPLSAIPTFDKSFKGDGDQVIHFTGDGSVADSTPNDNGRIFNVFTLTRTGVTAPSSTHTAAGTRSTRDLNSSIYTPRARGPFRSRSVLAPVPRIGPA